MSQSVCQSLLEFTIGSAWKLSLHLSKGSLMPKKQASGLTKRQQLSYLFIVFLLLCGTIAWRLFGTVVVDGDSMMPTLRSGESLTVMRKYKWFPDLAVGDIIVLKPDDARSDGNAVIKRIVFIQNKTGTASWPDTLMTKFGRFAAADLFPPGNPDCDLNRPNGIYVMGDNVDHSEDSRDYGPVTVSDVYGKVLGH